MTNWALATTAVLLLICGVESQFYDRPRFLPVSTRSDVISFILRARILSVDINGAAQILSGDASIDTLADGLKPPQGFAHFKSVDRNNDPDVVSIKAVAKAVLDAGHDTGLVDKLARVIVKSVTPPDGLPNGISEEELVEELNVNLSDTHAMQAILNADASKGDVSLGGLGRRLLSSYSSTLLSQILSTPNLHDQAIQPQRDQFLLYNQDA